MMVDIGAFKTAQKIEKSGNLIPNGIAQYMGPKATEELNVALHRNKSEMGDVSKSLLDSLFANYFGENFLGVHVITSQTLVSDLLAMPQEGKKIMERKMLYCSVKGYSFSPFRMKIMPSGQNESFIKALDLEREMEELVVQAMAAVQPSFWNDDQLHGVLFDFLSGYVMHAGLTEKAYEFAGLQALLGLFPRYVLAGSKEEDPSSGQSGKRWFMVKNH